MKTIIDNLSVRAAYTSILLRRCVECTYMLQNQYYVYKEYYHF